MEKRPDTGGPVCNLWTPALAKTPAYMADSSHLLLLSFLVIAQGFLHFPEHIAQVIQLFYLGAAPNGIVGRLNLEWVHVVYNWGLLIAMVPLMVGCGFFARGNAWRRYNFVAWLAICSSFWIQVWHAFEHYGKLAQYVRNLAVTPAVIPPDGPNAPGLVGQWILEAWGYGASVVILHFTVNLIVFLPLVYAWLAYDVPGAIAARLRGEELSLRPAR